jgi:23S rRNA (guanosine2251-2'-O)-methyltransferase
MAVLHGIHAVLEVLKADPGRIERICIEKGNKNSRIRELVDLARSSQVRISFEERSWLDRKAARARHQGVLCYADEITTLDIEEILEEVKSPGLLIILDGIEDPHNVGAILRSAEAADVDGVFVPRHRSSSLSPAVVKASAGAATHVKLSRVSNIVNLIETLKKRGFWVAGLDAMSTQSIWEADLAVPLALVLGSEGSGLHKLVKQKCDFLLSLPIYGNVGSYNVSVAAGIALYEVLRQRMNKKETGARSQESEVRRQE